MAAYEIGLLAIYSTKKHKEKITIKIFARKRCWRL